MTGRLSCFGWFLRSRGLVAVVAYLTVGMVCAHHLGGDLVTVPFAGSRSVDVGLGPSSLSGILASVLFSSPDPQREQAFPDRPIRTMRVVWAVIVLVWPVAWAVLFNGDQPISQWWVLWFARNHVLLVGLAMVASVVLSVAWAWLPGTIFVLSCWILGTKDSAATPYWWALLNQSPLAPPEPGRFGRVGRRRDGAAVEYPRTPALTLAAACVGGDGVQKWLIRSGHRWRGEIMNTPNPRVAKLADQIRVVVAETLERRVKDPRLGFVTITDVRLTGDSRDATLFWTAMGTDKEIAGTEAALESAKGMLRSTVGKRLKLRYAPTLTFVRDATPETAKSIEDALARAAASDAEIARRSQGAMPAGEADPYRHSDEEE
ncbi:hypothetical protein TIA2EST36_07450 [Cutibacterium acnes TypeIA2 P.acn31]|nr:hypothetical protein TIA2EST36_07450 [Cutibacterium acnes TypeIA2 P.acn31]